MIDIPYDRQSLQQTFHKTDIRYYTHLVLHYNHLHTQQPPSDRGVGGIPYEGPFDHNSPPHLPLIFNGNQTFPPAIPPPDQNLQFQIGSFLALGGTIVVIFFYLLHIMNRYQTHHLFLSLLSSYIVRNQKIGYPDTRCGIIPNRWTSKKLNRKRRNFILFGADSYSELKLFIKL